jgi:hypothetical protein
MRPSIVVIIAVISGCVGAAASKFVVPPALASDVTRWDYLCAIDLGPNQVQAKAKLAGREGWELTTATQVGYSTNLCFKRPLP